MNDITMDAWNAISATKAECFITIGNNRYNFMQALNLEAKTEKVKAEVPILGRMMKGNKTIGLKGSGSATFHYNTSIFRELLYDFQQTGKDVYFDIQVTNEDPTSVVGRQTVILKGCNIDGGLIAKFDADAEYLEDEYDFTFEGWEIPERFKQLPGMQQIINNEREDKRIWEI
uniref:phage tail tube protein n=1 Tax=Enterocloster clostridioformis TaxID=1531 RepID=UPI001C3DB1F1|nr:phage tail tube protein [Enterocloster clostridioformis]